LKIPLSSIYLASSNYKKKNQVSCNLLHYLLPMKTAIENEKNDVVG